MHAVILGFTVNKEMMDEVIPLDPNLSLQTYRFAWNLTFALKTAGLTVGLISAVPVTNYPGTKKLFFKSRIFNQSDIHGISISFINFFFLKHLTRFFSSLIKIAKSNRSKKIDYLFIHGIHSPFLVAGMLWRSKNRKVIVVLTDPPNVIYPTDDIASKAVKKIDGILIKFLINRMDGSICLSEQIAQDMAKYKPSIVIPGFVNNALFGYEAERDSKAQDGAIIIAYAGALDVRYGIANLAKAVAGISDFPVFLFLYGKGDLVNELKNGEFGDRVFYEGVFSQDALYKKLMNASVIVNPRPNFETFTKYSFPSKIVETLALGIPLMSTVLEGIPKEFFDHIWPIDSGDVAGIQKSIRDFEASSVVERKSKVISGRQFVKEFFSEEVQGLKIAEFLRNQLK